MSEAHEFADDEIPLANLLGKIAIQIDHTVLTDLLCCIHAFFLQPLISPIRADLPVDVQNTLKHPGVSSHRLHLSRLPILGHRYFLGSTIWPSKEEAATVIGLAK